jgi:hypothetical protein
MLGMGQIGKEKRRIEATPLTTKPVRKPLPTPTPAPAPAPVKEPAPV